MLFSILAVHPADKNAQQWKNSAQLCPFGHTHVYIWFEMLESTILVNFYVFHDMEYELVTFHVESHLGLPNKTITTNGYC